MAFVTFAGTDLRGFGIFFNSGIRIQTPRLRHKFTEIPGRPGKLMLSSSYDERLITFSGQMHADTTERLLANITALKSAVAYPSAQKLETSLEAGRYYLAQLQTPLDLSFPGSRQFAAKSAAVTLQFICYDPLAYSNEERSTIFSANGGVYPLGGQDNNGDAAVCPVIDMILTVNSATGITISHINEGKSFTLGGTYARGEQITVDCDKQTVVSSASGNIADDFSGNFFTLASLKCGGAANIFGLNCSSGSVAVNLHFRERYI